MGVSFFCTLVCFGRVVIIVKHCEWYLDGLLVLRGS